MTQVDFIQMAQRIASQYSLSTKRVAKETVEDTKEAIREPLLHELSDFKKRKKTEDEVKLDETSEYGDKGFSAATKDEAGSLKDIIAHLEEVD